MASDSERMTEVDTDDTASVARSDDTAASESGGRGDDPGTPPPATFRPIARPPRSEEGELPRLSLAVPPSPTRGPDTTYCNVTGRGGAKADYKRRTLEFVGAVSKPCKSVVKQDNTVLWEFSNLLDVLLTRSTLFKVYLFGGTKVY